jgi:hypothetical protein
MSGGMATMSTGKGFIGMGRRLVGILAAISPFGIMVCIGLLSLIWTAIYFYNEQFLVLAARLLSFSR